MKIHLVSGFLGQNSDWDSFRKELEMHFGNNISFTLSNLIEDIKNYNCDDLNDGFGAWARGTEKNLAAVMPDVVIAYSMGGRLFSHLDVEKIPSLKSVIFISNHWGLQVETEKQIRIQKDEIWSERFFSWPWGAIMREWNSQTVFSSDVRRPDRNEKNYDRKLLSEILKIWTLGRQSPRDQAIKAWSINKSWIYGEKDPLYSKLVSRSSELGCKVYKVLNAGHSPHLTHPRELAELIKVQKII